MRNRISPFTRRRSGEGAVATQLSLTRESMPVAEVAPLLLISIGPQAHRRAADFHPKSSSGCFQWLAADSATGGLKALCDAIPPAIEECAQRLNIDPLRRVVRDDSTSRLLSRIREI